MLRPALPRLLKHHRYCGAWGSVLWPKAGSHPSGAGASKNATLGAVGGENDWVLMYLFGFPGFTSDEQPGPDRRSGKAHGSVLFRPKGSPPPVPKVGVNGGPSLTLRIPPSSQPLTAQPKAVGTDLIVGICQLALTTSTRGTL